MKLTTVEVLVSETWESLLPPTWQDSALALGQVLSECQIGAFDRVVVAPRLKFEGDQPVEWLGTLVAFLGDGWRVTTEVETDVLDRAGVSALVEKAGYRLARRERRQKGTAA